MATTIYDGELRRLARDIERLQGFVEARRAWKLRPDRAEALTALYLTVISVLDEHLTPLLRQSHVEVEELVAPRMASQQPTQELDAVRLHSMTSYLERVTIWLDAHSSASLSNRGIALLVGISQSLKATAAALRCLARVNGLDLSAVGSLNEALSAAAQPAAAVAAAPANEPTDEPIDTRLVLEDCDETPLLQTFKGETELSELARRELDRFLYEAGVAYDGASRTRFERKVQEWIEATPPEHVLLLKVSALSGRREAYPNYARKTRLMGGMSEGLQA
jgi:hypothetical protein